MSEKYHEIMKQIEITPERQARILESVNRKTAGQRRPARFRKYQKSIGLVAGIALFIGACVWIPTRPADQKDPGENVQTTWDYQTFDSIQELSETVGFDVSELTGLPFEQASAEYAAIGHDLAQIQYSSGEDWLCYRKSKGTDDNSGDYNQYESEEEILFLNASVQLKGTGNGYVLAVWSDGSYSYSLSVSTAQTTDFWTRFFEQNQAALSK